MARHLETSDSLCYDDGDVVISLSPDPEDTLVLYSAVLKLHSDFFKASLSQQWIHSKITGTKVIDGREVPVVRYELEFDENIFDTDNDGDGGMLVGKVRLKTLTEFWRG